MTDKTRATLRLFLKEEILAYELETVIDVINDTYTSLRWLELAEGHTGLDPYGDLEFAADEFLKVQKAEIGTPNFVELHGLIDPLVQTLTYLGGIGGVVLIGREAISWGLDARKNWLESQIKAIELQERQDPRRKELEIRKLEADTKKAELEATKLAKELEEIRAGRKAIEPILDKAERLNRLGKASEVAVAYKKKTQERFAEAYAFYTVNNVVEGWEIVPD